MMMTHPYRTSSLFGAAQPWHREEQACALCALRARLRRVRLQTVVVGGLALAFLFLNAVGAASAYESMRLTRKLVANLTMIRSLVPTAKQASLATLASWVPPRLPEAPIGPTIVEVSPAEFLITRDVVDGALEEVAAVMPNRRITPEDGRNEVVAAGIRPNMLLARLGLRNGDIVRSVNHIDLGSPEAALEAYARLRGASDLLVEIRRGGALRRLRYHVI
jgi:hypothetical protein